MKNLTLILVFIFPLSSMAKLHTLVKITNDEDRMTSTMVIDTTEDGSITKFYHKQFNSDGTFASEKVFSPELGQAGQVLVTRKGKNAVVLRGPNMDRIYGGQLEIDYLYNGITGSRSSFALELEKNENGNWVLIRKNKVINHLHCVSNKKMIVGTIGIRSILVKK